MTHRSTCRRSFVNSVSTILKKKFVRNTLEILLALSFTALADEKYGQYIGIKVFSVLYL